MAPRTHRRHAVPYVLFALTLAAALALPYVVSAQEEVELTVYAKEGDPCERTFCFELSRTAVPAGASVNVTVINEEEDNAPHSFYFDWTGDYDTDHQDSSESAAEAEVETIGPNATGSTTFTAPTDRDKIYLWCGEQGHEQLGMWTEITVTRAPTGNGDDGTGGDGDDSQPPSTPGFGVVAALAAAGVAGALVSRRRR